ncbi:MAG: 16S rRNA (guanine(966)-N(2))-methyltransferase RsmD [Desulfovibrio sp.]|uniref:16S rRNA (guanine(966)-N(2))-methyltransferase RsmD n=1 Tax=Desulfovibrio sp. 7SRBS1 TaxID=3378064 RepID=UPI003B3CA39A
MRITAGYLKGQKILTTEGPGYRPATAKVREALFSMLTARGGIFSGCRVLDIFAGSGSLGIESLSRGAGHAAFIEKSRKAAGLIRKNLQTLDVPTAEWHIWCADCKDVLSKPCSMPYDLIFIDPPYGHGLLPPVLELAVNNGWLAEDGLVCAEVESGVSARECVRELNLTESTDRTYGQTRIVIWENHKTA